MFKILYAIQGTGNGHVARAREIVPLLRRFADVDIVLSGDQSQVGLPFPVKYRSKGLTFLYDKSGGISYRKTLRKNNLSRIFREIRHFPIEDYDLVINDFEFISAWACRLKKVPCIGMGHQAAFHSPKVPRPRMTDPVGERILKHYAPCDRYVGFHFDSFDKHIYTPVIRSEVRRMHTGEEEHYTVYLPAFGDDAIFRLLSRISNVEWQVFSRAVQVPLQKRNVQFLPVNNERFLESLASGQGLLTSAGFEGPAEALYLGKKLFTIPIQRQYEQFCNAEALRKLGVPGARGLNRPAHQLIEDWVYNTEALEINYPDRTLEILQKEIFAAHAREILAH